MAKILIVEDDKFLANAYRLKFTKSGFTVKLAMDGNEALKELETSSPDLIILDLIMPNKDGFSVLEDLKNSTKWKTIPVIVATNLEQKEDIDKAKSLGAIDYIVKSNTTIEEIINKVKSQLKLS